MLHLHDRGLTEWNPSSSTWSASLSMLATAALVVSVEDSSTLSTTELAYWSTALLQGSSVTLVTEGLSSSIAHLCRANHENQILLKQKMKCESTIKIGLWCKASLLWLLCIRRRGRMIQKMNSTGSTFTLARSTLCSWRKLMNSLKFSSVGR